MAQRLKYKTDIIELLEENTGKTFSDINCTNIFLVSQGNGNEGKNEQMGIIKLKNFCSAKKIIGGNICKQCNQQGLNFQNIETSHITQQQKSKQPNQKMSRRPK